MNNRITMSKRSIVQFTATNLCNLFKNSNPKIKFVKICVKKMVVLEIWISSYSSGLLSGLEPPTSFWKLQQKIYSLECIATLIQWKMRIKHFSRKFWQQHWTYRSGIICFKKTLGVIKKIFSRFSRTSIVSCSFPDLIEIIYLLLFSLNFLELSFLWLFLEIWLYIRSKISIFVAFSLAWKDLEFFLA